MELTEEQRAAVENQGGELLVSAAAGSGKTRVLVERLMYRLIRGEDVDRFLIITFTKAAASELRGKILDALNQELAQKPGDRHLQEQTSLVYQAQISTIDSFCQKVLEEEGRSLDLDPGFRVADEASCSILKRQVLEEVMRENYEKMESGSGDSENGKDGGSFSQMVDTFSEGWSDQNLVDAVLDIHGRIQSDSDPHAWLEKQCGNWEAFQEEGVEKAEDTEWSRTLVDFLLEDSRKQTEYWLGQIRDIRKQIERDAVLLEAYEPVLDIMEASLENFKGGLQKGWDEAREAGWDTEKGKSRLDYDNLNNHKPKNPGKKTSRKKTYEEEPQKMPYDEDLRTRFKDLRERCKKEMDKVTEHFSPSSAQLLDDMRSAAPAVISLLKLVEEFDEAYAEEKRRQNLLDFSDLEHMALKILTDGEGNPTPAARKLEHRYAEVMVDEYQDTNQVQNAIFNAVSDQGRKLFLVGDMKQSIYRFRLADPGIFLHKFETFRDSTGASEGEQRKIVLSWNFRSRKSVLDAVNFVFRSLMSRDFGGIDYESEGSTEDPEAHRDHWLYSEKSHLEETYPEYEKDRTELYVLDLKGIWGREEGQEGGEEEDGEDEEERKEAQVEADFIARRIRRLKEEKHCVTKKDPDTGKGTLVPVEWSDIAILVRSLSSDWQELTAALTRYGIPWQMEGKQDILKSEEIMVAVSCLQILDNPHQDVPLVAVLRSPLYGFTPDQMAEIRAGSRREDGRNQGDFYTALCRQAENGDRACGDFLREFDNLRELGADRTASEILWDLYEQTGMLSIYGALDNGETRRSNLILLYEYARQFEQNGYQSLFDFVTHLRRLQDSGKGLELSGAGGSGVRIMTVHRSKGLQFPVVILARLSKQIYTKDENRPVLFHAGMGVGPQGAVTENGVKVKYPTLARTAIQRKLKQETWAEELRLLYVAMTRAEEKLILYCTLRNAQTEKEHSSSALKKLTATAGFPMDARALWRMYNVGDWVVSAALTRKENAAGSIRIKGDTLSDFPDEGRDTPWEIHLETRMPEEPEQNPRPEPGQGEVREELRLEDWEYPQKGAEEIRSRLTATGWNELLRSREIPVGGKSSDPRAPVYGAEDKFPDPSFVREEGSLSGELAAGEKGTAQHLFMQLCDPDRASTLDGAEEEISRLVGNCSLTEAQAEACSPEQAAEFFRSEQGVEARAHDRKREFRFSLLADASDFYGEAGRGEEVLLQGVVDLWYETREGITIVDYKTDRIEPGQEASRAEQYRHQLEFYAYALERITGKKVAHRYLWFFRTGRAFELKDRTV